ncbi:two-component system response regulator CreB [Thalassolituus sp. LLYu03]|uniref:two-component system response regulator CreB n=1 Tax=Thalassolituus sp. LLYu03 TaxID=3421656 RepID=UPI003D2AD958
MVQAKPHVLVVEDESSIADSLQFVLQNEGFTTHCESQAGRALNYLQEYPQTALVIMDIGLPDMTGLEACKQLRRFSDIPLVFLTARSDEIDRILGLEIGADDYVTKPFSPREVAARVKAILKRSAPQPAVAVAAENPAQKAFSLNDQSKTIAFYGQPLPLTRLEYQILATLLTRPGQVFSREQLLNAAGISADANYERSIDSHIKSLRAKLASISAHEKPIKTHRGFGYSCQPEQ